VAVGLTGQGAVPAPLAWATWSSALAGLALVLPGTLLALRLPRNPLCWLLILGGGSSVAAALGASYARLSLLDHDGELPLTWFAVFAGGRFGPLIHVVIPGLLLFFPDGRLPSRRWRIPAGLALAGMVAGDLMILTIPWRIFNSGEPISAELARFPLDPWTPALPEAFWLASSTAFQILLAGAFLIGTVAFVSRFRKADPQLRAQIRWMLLAGLINVALMVFTMVLAVVSGTDNVIFDVSFVLENVIFAGAVLIAVTRYRLYDVDLLLGRTLLYGTLAALVAGIDLAVFVGVGSVVTDRVAGVAAAGVVAVLYSPLRLRLQRVVDRILTGRGDPYDVVSALARRLEETTGPDDLLQETARSVAAAFRSPYVRVELDRADGHTVIVEHGTARTDTVVLPFAYRGVPIGRLSLVPRLGARLSDADQRLLADVVRQAAAAARATALTGELQRSREQLVTGIAEERRRLRRDLHDGLGPALAAAGLKIQAARNLADRDAVAADAALSEVSRDLTGVLADVRRLVHDLRPPALDQFGLAGAIVHQAGRFDGAALNVTVESEGDLGALPAAVEVAAYRIVGEALNNVSRHAGAGRCGVGLIASGGVLRIEVTDDGRGVPAGMQLGVGLVAMRERAEELGGRCAVLPRAGGGTLVCATIPFEKMAAPAGQGA
jgi:signal transduction histidine kinase